MDSLIAQKGGRIANTAGDSVLAEFPSAVDAVQCAVADTEEIITGLARFRSLFVIARNSSFAFRDDSTDVAEVGRRLGVSHVVEGASVVSASSFASRQNSSRRRRALTSGRDITTGNCRTSSQFRTMWHR
jgi:hypothetical protein